jgi:ketopantoate reductase
VRILIVGLGVIGSTYGWALSEKGIDVTHFVRKGRKEKAQSGIFLDIYDTRPHHVEFQKITYEPHLIEEIAQGDHYDYVIVPTRHYQSAVAVSDLKDQLPDSVFFMFTANWEGPQAIDALLERSRYLWGYPASTGGFHEGVLRTNISPRFRIGILEGGNPVHLQKLLELFAQADFNGEKKDNIIEWLWVHFAVAAGSIGTALESGGLKNLIDKGKEGEEKFLGCIQDTLRAVEKRGIKLSQYEEAVPFINPETTHPFQLLKDRLLQTPWGQRVLQCGHLQNNQEEMIRYVFDVVETAQKLKVSIPFLSECKKKIEELL